MLSLNDVFDFDGKSKPGLLRLQKLAPTPNLIILEI